MRSIRSITGAGRGASGGVEATGLQHALEALLEVAPELGAGQHPAQVERVDEMARRRPDELKLRRYPEGGVVLVAFRRQLRLRDWEDDLLAIDPGYPDPTR